MVAGKTQEHVALEAVVSVRTVRRAETTGKVSAENLRSLCAALGLDMPRMVSVPGPGIQPWVSIAGDVSCLLRDQVTCRLLSAACIPLVIGIILTMGMDEELGEIAGHLIIATSLGLVVCILVTRMLRPVSMLGTRLVILSCLVVNGGAVLAYASSSMAACFQGQARRSDAVAHVLQVDRIIQEAYGTDPARLSRQRAVQVMPLIRQVAGVRDEAVR